MIFNTGSHLSPKISIEIGNVEVNYVSITTINLELTSNKHDTLTLHMNGIPSKAITDYVGAPVRFSISNGPGRSQQFVGYVLYVEPSYNSSAPIVNESVFYSAKIVCLGASIVMKSARSRVWGATTIHKVAQEIASTYEFSLSCFKDSFVIRNAVQSNESDWKFLTRLCDLYGYSMTVHGTHMSVWEPFQSIGRRPSLDRLVPTTAYSGPNPGTILKLDGTFGYLTPDGESYKYRISSIDDTGNVSTVSDPIEGPVDSWSGTGETPSYISTITDIASSVGEGQKMLDAKRRKNFAFNAHVTVSAGAGNVPGGIVLVEGYKADFEGPWYVQSVHHHISKSGYFTEMHISRDYNTSGTYVTPSVDIASNPPESNYVDNKWVASKQLVDLYV